MVTVRAATVADADVVHRLILALATHHGHAQYVRVTPADLRRDGFGDAPKFGVLLAELAGVAIGFASYTFNYSIWLGGPIMNIDDVFVEDAHRGRGAGEALMRAAQALCRERGLSRMRWEVQTDNLAAIRFYERMGATLQTKGIFRWTV